jgi:transcriptional regulator with XRE-family HTH domain
MRATVPSDVLAAPLHGRAIDAPEAAVYSRGPPLPDLGARLRRLRRIRGLKQDAIAALAGVAQTTISRWEHGEIEPRPDLAERLLATLGGRIGIWEDRPLRRLIETSPLAVHLVTDADHRLLAASARREQEWGQRSDGLAGQSLWRFATDAIRAAEAGLRQTRWWDDDAMPQVVELRTGEGRSGLSIRDGMMVWERLYLADATPVRLCTTTAYLA